MTDKKTGGPAFPETAWASPDGMCLASRQEGMTLRDYFAAKAMQTMIGMITGNTSESEISRIPESAYSYADDMIKEREK